MGKREIGELSVIDFIVSIFIAEVVAISIENYEKSIFISLIPIIVLVLLQVIFAKISLKSETARNIIDGSPSVIINRGKINFKEIMSILKNFLKKNLILSLISILKIRCLNISEKVH